MIYVLFMYFNTFFFINYRYLTKYLLNPPPDKGIDIIINTF